MQHISRLFLAFLAKESSFSFSFHIMGRTDGQVHAEGGGAEKERCFFRT